MTAENAIKQKTLSGKAIQVSVPCSTANLGPGFDCLGLALNLYLKVEAQFGITDPLIPLVEQCGPEGQELPCDHTNPLWQTLARLLDSNTLNGLRLKVASEIPPGRGLGSSAAVAVAAVTIARRAQNLPADREAIFKATTKLEGHPDNAAACVFGDFTVSGTYAGETICKNFLWPSSWQCLVVSPSYELSTNKSRAALPQQVSHQDAVFNLQHTAALVAAVAAADERLFALALQDRLHQPYREKLVPELIDLQKLCNNLPAFGCVLSGAGPSVLIICSSSHCQKVKQGLEDWRTKQTKPYILRILEADHQGVTTRNA